MGKTNGKHTGTAAPDSEATLFICLSESAIDAARSVGLNVATGGQGLLAPAATDWEQTARYGRVRILPPNDDAGRLYARQAAREILTLNRSADVRIVELPDLTPGGDIGELIECQQIDGKDEAAIRAYIEALAGSAKPIDPTVALGGLMTRKASSVEVRDVDWLWMPYLVGGAINMIVGMPCTGKGIYTMDVAARVSTGTAWPPIGGHRQNNRVGSVAILSIEDSPETTIVPRLQVAGADLDKIHIVEGVRRISKNGATVKDGFDIARDIQHLAQLHEMSPDLRLVIIDPLDSYIGASVDTNIGNKSRAALWPLKDWAEASNVCVLIVHHFNKTATTVAMDKVSGARSFGALPRSVWAIGEDELHDRTIIAPIKMNLVPKDEKRPLAYRIIPSPNNPKHPIASWLDEEIDMTANELVGERGNHARDDADQFLRDVLADGPMDSKRVLQLAEEAGHTKRTTQRAKKDLGVVAEQRRSDDGGKIDGWDWRLP